MSFHSDFIDSIKKYQYKRIKSSKTRAGVSIILVRCADSFEILFVRRSKKLREHAGEIAFPGGRVENCDQLILDTAIRETIEETQILLNKKNFIGRSDDFASKSNYLISPHVFYLSKRPHYVLSAEHELLFFAPVKYLMNEKNQKFHNILYHNKNWTMYDFYYKNYRIWGVTGWILNNFFSIQESYSSFLHVV